MSGGGTGGCLMNTGWRLVTATALVAALAGAFYALVRRAVPPWGVMPIPVMVLGMAMIGLLGGLAMRSWWAIILVPAAVVAGPMAWILTELGDWMLYLRSRT